MLKDTITKPHRSAPDLSAEVSATADLASPEPQSSGSIKLPHGQLFFGGHAAAAHAEMRTAQIKQLGDRANTISALLSTIHLLDADSQNDALLDCSSLSDDFARDLDAFGGAAA